MKQIHLLSLHVFLLNTLDVGHARQYRLELIAVPVRWDVFFIDLDCLHLTQYTLNLTALPIKRLVERS